jgi:hypothetical protein
MRYYQKLTSLHQLQNIYFLLKGRELQFAKSNCRRLTNAIIKIGELQGKVDSLIDPRIIFTYESLFVFITLNRLHEPKLFHDLTFQITMEITFSNFKQSVLVSNDRILVVSAVLRFGSIYK